MQTESAGLACGFCLHFDLAGDEAAAALLRSYRGHLQQIFHLSAPQDSDEPIFRRRGQKQILNYPLKMARTCRLQSSNSAHLPPDSCLFEQAEKTAGRCLRVLFYGDVRKETHRTSTCCTIFDYSVVGSTSSHSVSLVEPSCLTSRRIPKIPSIAKTMPSTKLSRVARRYSESRRRESIIRPGI